MGISHTSNWVALWPVSPSSNEGMWPYEEAKRYYLPVQLGVLLTYLAFSKKLCGVLQGLLKFCVPKKNQPTNKQTNKQKFCVPEKTNSQTNKKKGKEKATTRNMNITKGQI